MILRFTKGDGKPDTLTCVRDDGSTTFAPSAVGTRHDLIHYAVETVLGYTDAFYGLVAGGRDIDSFGTRNGRKDTYPDEAIFTELLVGLLQWPALSGQPLADAEIFEALEADCASRNLPDGLWRAVTVQDIRAIRERMLDLFRKWDMTPAASRLELPFPPP